MDNYCHLLCEWQQCTYNTAGGSGYSDVGSAITVVAGWSFTLCCPNMTSPAASFAAINCDQVITDFLQND